MTGKDHTQKFFQYLQDLQYYTITEFILRKFIITIVLLNIFTLPITLLLLLCLLLVCKYTFSFVDLARNFDRRYGCSDCILSTYYLTKEPQKTIFYTDIVSQAITQLQRYLTQEKTRMRKIYLRQVFILVIAVMCLGINYLPSTQKSLPTSQKKILRISAKKIQKIAKNIEMVNREDAKFLQDIAKTWQQVNIEHKEVAKSLQALQRKLQKIDQEYKKQEAQRISIEQQLQTLSAKNKQRILEKIAQHLPTDAYKKMRQHIENNEQQKALQVYKSSKTQLPIPAIREAQNLTNKLGERLLAKTTQMKALVNSPDPFTEEMPPQEFHFSKANVLPSTQGWETITYPSKYHAIVHSYLDERNKDEKK